MTDNAPKPEPLIHCSVKLRGEEAFAITGECMPDTIKETGHYVLVFSQHGEPIFKFDVSNYPRGNGAGFLVSFIMETSMRLIEVGNNGGTPGKDHVFGGTPAPYVSMSETLQQLKIKLLPVK